MAWPALGKQRAMAFHSTKTFKNLQTAANGTDVSQKSFQKFRKLLNFRNSNHSTENSRTFGNKVEWKETFREKCFQKFGYTSRGCSLFGNFGKCCANRYWKLPKIQTGCFGWMERAQNIQTKEDYCHIAVSTSRFFVVTTWHCLNYSFLTNMPRRRILWIKDPK